MDFETALSTIDAAASIPSLQTVFFSGGEIFIFYDELLSLMKAASQRFTIICATNGFWGYDYSDASKKLRRLKNAGLSKLLLSYDVFHAKYTPPQSIKNILKICKELQIQAEIESVACKTSWRLSKTADMLLDDILEIPISEAALLPIGAAVNLPADSLLYENDSDMDRCLGSNAITILPDGTLYSCCSPACASIPVLQVGTIKNGEDISALLQSAVSNKMLGRLRKYGISGTCSRFFPHDAITPKQRYVNTCDKCHHMLSQVTYRD